MKKFFFLLVILFTNFVHIHADEGMWLLKLMVQQHLEDSLKKAGLLLSPEMLYSETSPSLRECIGIFGGGCTGEVVSSEGLVLTNHHCGFSYVHEMSGIGHDYMKDGFFAKSRAEELQTPSDLTFTFVLRIVDVTDSIVSKAKEAGADEYTTQSYGFLEPIATEMLQNSDLNDKKGVRAEIVPYFGGNQFYLFFLQEFQDVRLVANPPYNVGQFGGNSDNWMWPRQNADFAMFRIYADKDGQPAPYSPDNVPLKCKKYLPISLKGIQEGDYTMIMGFPGSTSRYLTAAEVTQRIECTNKPIVLAGEPLLNYYKNFMDQSDELRLLLEDDYFSWGNAVKNFGGMNEAVEKNHLIDQKKAEENTFRAFAKKSGNAEYDNVIERIATLCETYKDTLYDTNLMSITLLNQKVGAPIEAVNKYVDAVRSNNAEEIQSTKESLRQNISFPNKEVLDIDRNQALLLIPYYIKNKKLAFSPTFLSDGGNTEAFINKAYTSSIFTDSLRFNKVLEANDTLSIQNDPLYIKDLQISTTASSLYEATKRYKAERKQLDKIYVRGLCEMYDWAKAPDANFTLRMTYGHVCDLNPRDAVHYDWRTVLDGMFEKESQTESDYFVNEKLRNLYKAGDFGQYAREDGKLPACFLTNNDITGGNSGSPVMNAKGELIGLAFDGNIESLSSDLKFNPALQRCINVDIRYVLFILEKFGGSTYVFDELELRK